jgi:hypothetical protein
MWNKKNSNMHFGLAQPTLPSANVCSITGTYWVPRVEQTYFLRYSRPWMPASLAILPANHFTLCSSTLLSCPANIQLQSCLSFLGTDFVLLSHCDSPERWLCNDHFAQLSLQRASTLGQHCFREPSSNPASASAARPKQTCNSMN